jgi:hypothetical protein
MPTVLREGPYRFYWYSHEPGEPPHVHVDRGDYSAKFWLRPVALPFPGTVHPFLRPALLFR